MTLLQRRHIRIASITPIGKESNRLEEVEAGLIHSEEDVYTIYSDQRDEWATKIRPALKKPPLATLEKETGISRRALINLRAGRSRPHAKNLQMIVAVLRKLAVL